MRYLGNSAPAGGVYVRESRVESPVETARVEAKEVADDVVEVSASVDLDGTPAVALVVFDDSSDLD